MEWQGWFSLTLIVLTLAVLIITSIGPHVVMMGSLTILLLAGILTSSEALAGFANPGLITVAAMFVVAAGLHSSGGIELLVRKLLGQPKSLRPALFKILFPAATLSGFMNNTPVVATMIPAIHSWSRRINISPSKLMIPLSYGAILGGTLTMIGSSTNLVVNGEYQVITGEPGFGLFFITSIGLPVAIIGCIFIWLWFPRVLPDRQNVKLFDGELREFTVEVSIQRDGPLVDKELVKTSFYQLPRLSLTEIERADEKIKMPHEEVFLEAGDRLVFTGDVEAISDLLATAGLTYSHDNSQTDDWEFPAGERHIVEAVISHHSSAVGKKIRDARFFDRYGAVILAVARFGERVRGNLGTIRLRAGDTLLLQSRPEFVSTQKFTKDFLLISESQSEPLRHKKAWIAWTLLVVLVASAGFGILTMLQASLMAAGLMILLGCCSLNAAERSLDLKVLITIGASFALGMALKKTGVAAAFADLVVELAMGKPWLMLVMVYFSVSMLTEVITNNGAALLMLPVALTLTDQVGLEHEPFVVAVMIAASASFATPLGYQTNLMVYGPGGYRFSDYIKVGLPMNLFVGMVSLTLINFKWDLVL